MSNLYHLLAAQASCFLIRPPFLGTVGRVPFDAVLLVVRRLCGLRGAMQLHWSPSASCPAVAGWGRGGQDFPAHILHLLPVSLINNLD